MDDYKPTTYQITKASNWSAVEFDDGHRQLTIYLNTRAMEVGIDIRIDTAEGKADVNLIIIEQEIFVKALQDAGIIPA